MTSSDIGILEAWVPRGLVANGSDVLSAPVTSEGLCPLKISWENGKINNLEVINNSSRKYSKLLLPRLVEPHAHIDKAFTWGEFPNLSGTYGEALQANLNEFKCRTINQMVFRAEKALKLALNNGLRSVRTHIDSFGISGKQSWKTLIDLKIQWESLIELQCVALVPLEYWSTEEGNALAALVANSGGLLGGVLVPPFDLRASYRDLFNLLSLANQLGCGIDLHIDESDKYPAAGLKQLLRVLNDIQLNVPITCSHSSSMGLLPKRELKKLAERLAHHKVNVIALPLTNSWLLGRQGKNTPVQRPLAPIRQLQTAGVTVAIGGDNMQDPWFPFGNFDPMALMAFSMPLTQLAPWQRVGLAPFTTAAASLMNLDWDGTIEIGNPADFVVLEANSWAEALSAPPRRDLIVNGSLLKKEIISTSKHFKENE